MFNLKACQSKQSKVSFLVGSLVCACTFNVNALEALSDETLSNQVGKDGVTINIGNDGTIGLDSVTLIQNENNFSSKTTTYNNSAGVKIDTSSGKIRFCSSETAGKNCALNTGNLTIEVDTDGGNGSAFINAKIVTSSKSIYIPATTISLVGSDTTLSGNRSGANTVSWTKEVPIVEFTDGIKIEGKSGLTANIQLGAQPQGNMILIAPPTDDAGTNIKLGNINVNSQDENSTKVSQISTNVSILGFGGKLDDGTKSTGTAIDIDGTDGLVVSKEVATIQKITMNDTVLGKVNEANADTFNNLQNSSIGNISIQNIKLNNLKIGVQGM